MSGYSDGTFRPNNDITRGQASKILANAAGLSDPIPPSGLTGAGVPISRQTFEDVPPSHTFYTWVERLAGQGAIGGYPCGGPFEPCASPANRPYFRPGSSITRGQASKIAALTANLTDLVAASQQRFADVPPNQPFWIWIEQMTGRSVMGGYPCGANVYEPCDQQNRPYFRPGNSITRGQASKVVANLFYPNGQPVVPCGPSGGELLGGGGGNPSQASNVASDGVNVNTATGNFSHDAVDFAIPGRGPALLFSRTYNSLAASVPGPLGYGWTHSYNMWISGPTNPVVHQQNGSTAPFLGSGPNYEHDPRLLAELVRNGDDTYTLTYAQGQMRFFFNAQGKLTEIRDRNNYATTLAYNGSGQLTAVTDPAGRQLLFTYDAGRVSRVDDVAGGRSVTYAYVAGNLITVTDVAANLTHFTYDGRHRLLTLTDTNGGMLSNSYDEAGRVVSQVAPISRVYSFAYVTEGNHTVTTVTDPLGIVSVYTYTCSRLTKLVQDAGGSQQATWTYTYGAGYVSGLASVTDPNGHTWTSTWDSQGNSLTRGDPLGQTTTSTYNTRNDLLIVTNPLGVPTSFTYDAEGNVLSISQPLIQSNQIATTRYGYDPVHPGDAISKTDPLNNTWRTTYDTYGYVSSSVNPLNENTSYAHDALGRQLSVTSPRGYTATTTYNAYGDPLSNTDFRNNTTTYTYDPNRNLLTVRDANNQVTTDTYNLANWRIRVTQPDGTHSDTSYDCAGHAITQANGLGQITTYEYDALGRVIRQTDALNHSTQYGYDDAGRMVSRTDPLNRITQYGYDDAGQLTTINYNGGAPSVSLAYDRLGRRSSMTDGSGLSTYDYDSLNRLTRMKHGTEVINYGYDLAGNQTALSYPSPNELFIQYFYDGAHRMTDLNDPSGFWPTQFQYDTDGNLTAKILPNDTRTDMGYNADGQVLSITHSLGSTPFLALTYGRDGEGLLTSATEPGRGTNSYTYDGLDRLTGDALTGGAPVTRAWGYNGAYEITNTSILPGGAPVTTTRSYNSGNELLSLIERQGGVLTRDRTFTYDANGDRTGQTGLGGPEITYVYNQANQLISYSEGNTSTTYTYNGDGLRMSKTQGANTETFLWDVSGGLPLLLADGTARYLYGSGGQPLAEVMNGTNATYYYHADQLGSVRALTAGGTLVNTYTYDPYGVALTSTGTAYNPFGYTGEYRDAESGLIYLRARYYDPITQQFLTVDPLLAATKQAYAYAGNSPLNRSDPSGLVAGCANGPCGGSSPDGTKFEMITTFPDGTVSHTCSICSNGTWSDCPQSYAPRPDGGGRGGGWLSGSAMAGLAIKQQGVKFAQQGDSAGRMGPKGIYTGNSLTGKPHRPGPRDVGVSYSLNSGCCLMRNPGMGPYCEWQCPCGTSNIPAPFDKGVGW
jgi:RHS repeat-associated protein